LHIEHGKQFKLAAATAKLAQNSALSARTEKGICILLQLWFSTIRTWSKTNNLSG